MRTKQMLMLVMLVTGVFAQVATAAKPSIVIEWGQNTPDTTYLRLNTAECEKLPVDGVSTFICYPRFETGRLAIKPIEKQYDAAGKELPAWTMPSGQRVGDYNLGRRVLGYDRISHDQCAAAVEDLRQASFNRFKHNYLTVLLGNNIKPMNWFDEEHWDTICHNVAVIARAAKESGCDGLLIDPEIYGYPMWQFSSLSNDPAKVPPQQAGIPDVYHDKTWEQVQAAAKQRGKQFVEAIESEYPGATLWTCFAYSFSVKDCKGKPQNLPNTHYALLPAFIDGMIEGSSDDLILIDGNETSYRFKTRDEFVEGRRQCLEGGASLTTLPPELFQRKLRVGFGLWVDHDQKWDPQHPETNPFTPEEFEQAVRHALDVGDGYVWLWSEIANWYADSPTWKPGHSAPVMARSLYVPQAYRNALAKAQGE